MKNKRENHKLRMIVEMAIKMFRDTDRADVLNFMKKMGVPFRVAKRINREMDKENLSKSVGIPL